jgi:hypothetical protein
MSTRLNSNQVNIKNVIDITRDYLIEVSKGNVPGASIAHIVGSNSDVTTTLVPVTDNAIFRTPTSSVTLEAISTSANDTAAGTGARSIRVKYIKGSDWTIAEAVIAMNGLTATTETIPDVIRVLEAKVETSGSYADQITSSHAGVITIREVGAGQEWARIQVVGGFGYGKTGIGAYTVPAGKTAYIITTTFSVDSNKTVDLHFFSRENSDIVVAPYSALTLEFAYKGLGGYGTLEHKTNESFPGCTDIGYMAIDAAGAAVTVEFEILLIDD